MRLLCVILSGLIHGLIFGFVSLEGTKTAVRSVTIDLVEVDSTPRTIPKTLNLKPVITKNDTIGNLPVQEAPVTISDSPGGGNVLESREFLYSSYYHRIRESLRNYWIPCIRKIRAKSSHTLVQMLLDRRGEWLQTQVLGSNGSPASVKCAEMSIRQAARFPGPPKGIVDHDGLIRIKWIFRIL